MTRGVALQPSWLRRLAAWRFARFGTVGALGTVVNLVVLWLGQEWLLARIEPASLRLSLALAVSIAVSTVHNFFWNRAWTWADRREAQVESEPLLQQFGRYALACWFGILLQFILTRALADSMHYLLAAALAIALASVANYVVNDLWTFGRELRAAPSRRMRLAVMGGLVALTAWAYGYGLDGQHIPRNGDELVYAHITRETASTGHWLPLASTLDGMRNTKPPLLFWQGLASTGFGEHWSLERLRWPSVAWTFATALAIGLVAARLSRRRAGDPAPPGSGGLSLDLPTGLIAALVWLGFFGTFRFGRPYLTTPAEVFWLAVPLLAVLVAADPGRASRRAWPVGLGVAIGIGLLSKSFALLLPVGAVLALWLLQARGWRMVDCLRRDGPGLLVTATVALAVFAGWFALDPDPQAVWREFVVGENLGKVGDRGFPLLTLLVGPDSVWEYGAATLLNTGLLAGVALATLAAAWRARRRLDADEQRLWIWLGVFFVVFALPSQRSARYLLPAMPALAILLALHWRRLPAWGFRLGHGLALVVVGVLTWLALGLQDGAAAAALPIAPVRPMAWAVFLLAATVALAGLSVRAVQGTALLAVAAMVHLSIGAFLAPFQGPAGDYPPAAVARAVGATVWVPCNFRARFEAHGFLLPGSTPRGWDERAPDAPRDAEALATRYPLFAVRQRLSQPPPRCEGCTVLGDRLDLRSRHASGELRALFTGDAVNQLFTREWLVLAAPRPSHAAHAGDAQCL